MIPWPSVQCTDAEDLSIIGAGNIEGLHHPNPFLTTVDWPRVELGRAAAKLLLAQIENPGETETPEEILAPLVLSRQSTAALAAGRG